MNSDFKDLLRIFSDEEVEFLVVGGYAVIHHTQPRYTKDLDIWLKPSPENARRIWRAFSRFGVPTTDVTEGDFASEGLQYAIGLPPSQIDFLTSLPGADLESSWRDRVEGETDGLTVPFLGIKQLVAAKTVAGRRILPTSMNCAGLANYQRHETGSPPGLSKACDCHVICQ